MNTGIPVSGELLAFRKGEIRRWDQLMVFVPNRC